MIVGSPTVLNLVPSGAMPVVYINETDKHFEKEFLIYNGTQPFSVPVNVSGTIRGTKGDGLGVTEAANVTAGSNRVTIEITEQMTAVAGPNLYELVFVSTDGMRVGTINFIMMVEKSALNSGTVISDSDIAYAEQVVDNLGSIAAYGTILVNKPYKFDTVAQMVADTSLEARMYAITGGYHSVNDGGGSLYRIDSTAPVTHYETLTNGLYAELIVDGFYTPEMFGAYGDGVHDDTAAIQAAINAGKHIVCEKRYLTTGEILINKHGINFDARTAEFIYTGNTSAFVLSHINGGFVYINKITSSGNCIEFRSSVGSADNTESVYLYFNVLLAEAENGSCILINAQRPGWANSNFVYGGEMLRGAYGVRGISDIVTGWRFSNIGFGNLKCAFRFTIPSGGQYMRFIFEKFRYEEYSSTSKLFEIDGGGEIRQWRFYGDYDFNIEDRFTVSGITIRDWLIDAPILRPSVSSAIYAAGAWITANGLLYLTRYSLQDKDVVETMGIYNTGALTLNDQFVSAGTCVYYRYGPVCTIVFNNLQLLSNSGTLVSAIPAAIAPAYDIPLLFYDTNNTVIARGFINRTKTITMNGLDTSKTYRGAIAYSVMTT